MATEAKRKTPMTLAAARDLGINVSAVAETALRDAVSAARRHKWLDENAEAFAAQARWRDRIGHPLADIMASPGGATRKA